MLEKFDGRVVVEYVLCIKKIIGGSTYMVIEVTVRVIGEFRARKL